MSIQVKATEQYFPVVLFIMLHEVVLIFKSVNDIFKCNHSNKSYRAELSRECSQYFSGCSLLCCEGGSIPFSTVCGDSPVEALIQQCAHKSYVFVFRIDYQAVDC